MKFIVNDIDITKFQAIEEIAVRHAKLTYLDERTWKSLAAVEKEARHNESAKDWLKAGKNHRETKSGVVSDFENVDAFYIILKSMKDIIKCNNKYGELSIFRSNYKEIPLQMHIVDSRD